MLGAPRAACPERLWAWNGAARILWCSAWTERMFLQIDNHIVGVTRFERWGVLCDFASIPDSAKRAWDRRIS